MEKLLALAIVAVLAITVAAGVGIANMSQNGNTLAAPEPKAKNQIIAKPRKRPIRIIKLRSQIKSLCNCQKSSPKSMPQVI